MMSFFESSLALKDGVPITPVLPHKKLVSADAKSPSTVQASLSASLDVSCEVFLSENHICSLVVLGGKSVPDQNAGVPGIGHVEFASVNFDAEWVKKRTRRNPAGIASDSGHIGLTDRDICGLLIGSRKSIPDQNAIQVEIGDR